MNILVTGGNGQLGCSFREKAADSGHRFVFADIRPGGDIVLDVTDLEAVCRAVEEHDVDIIMNCAAYTDVATDVQEVLQGLKARRNWLAGSTLKPSPIWLKLPEEKERC